MEAATQHVLMIFVTLYAFFALLVTIWMYSVIPTKCVAIDVRNSLEGMLITSCMLTTLCIVWWICEMTCVTGTNETSYTWIFGTLGVSIAMTAMSGITATKLDTDECKNDKTTLARTMGWVLLVGSLLIIVIMLVIAFTKISKATEPARLEQRKKHAKERAQKMEEAKKLRDEIRTKRKIAKETEKLARQKKHEVELSRLAEIKEAREAEHSEKIDRIKKEKEKKEREEELELLKSIQEKEAETAKKLSLEREKIMSKPSYKEQKKLELLKKASEQIQERQKEECQEYARQIELHYQEVANTAQDKGDMEALDRIEKWRIDEYDKMLNNFKYCNDKVKKPDAIPSFINSINRRRYGR